MRGGRSSLSECISTVEAAHERFGIRTRTERATISGVLDLAKNRRRQEDGGKNKANRGHVSARRPNQEGGRGECTAKYPRSLPDVSTAKRVFAELVGDDGVKLGFLEPVREVGVHDDDRRATAGCVGGHPSVGPDQHRRLLQLQPR